MSWDEMAAESRSQPLTAPFQEQISARTNW